MFFSGDPSTRKRVDLGGRSSKERDREKHLEHIRVERDRRLRLRQQNSAALKIQKCFRGRKAVRTVQSKLREQFYKTHGKYVRSVDRDSLHLDSDFLRQFLYFFEAENVDDYLVLLRICQLLRQFVQDNGGVVRLFDGIDCSSTCALVDYQVKQFVYSCICALRYTRYLLDTVAVRSLGDYLLSAIALLEVLVLLIDPKLPWSSKIVGYLSQNNAFRPFREIVLKGKTLAPHNYLKFLGRMSSKEFPSYAFMLGSILETAGIALSQPDCLFDMTIDIAAVTTIFLDMLPSVKTSDSRDGSMISVDDVTGDDNSINPGFLRKLTNIRFRDISSVNDSDGPDDREVAAVGAVCGFLYVTFRKLPLEWIMNVLAYKTELVPMLWNFMKRCHENKKWSSLSEWLSYLSGDAPGWLLPLAVFCPVYKHMLMRVDNEEFYEQEKPLSLKDIRSLIIILRQALWQLLWVNHSTSTNLAKSVSVISASKRHPVEAIQLWVSIVVSELLSQLQDWNNRRQFTSPSDFHADGVNDFFISQAFIENTPANEVLKQAPFLIPFTSRVKIFCSQLVAARQSHGSQAVFTRNRFRIKRDRILEDGCNQMSQLSEDNLRGLSRVTFVNEFGVEEAGIDGGGIFKDFMENITHAAFDVQYGLFKETADHLLYPNPGSGMIHEQHFQFFHFLGTLLAKAMFEGILVDILFAAFFLSKLKQKWNCLNDLPSLDPELYRHLVFLKHYRGDISDLELYFVIVNNEYGEQKEEELLPGGANLRVTSENVIDFIHLVANHRLNLQICQQSSHFLRGFQQLIRKDLIDMFNEHELQVLISGSLDNLDFDDLRLHTNYAGGYHSEHYVIERFWDVLEGFSLENQKKFLKFVTGCSRGPLLGFRYLEPLFCIQRAAGDASDEALDRLPTSATCMNLLKLPPYRSKEQLETKLLYAINADAGFDLS